LLLHTLAQVRFWGIDSGIRHSNGGSDYTSVRVGTFMGLKLISEAARRLQRNSSSVHDGSSSNSSSHPGSSSVAAVLTAAVSPLHRDAVQSTNSEQQQSGGIVDSNSGRAGVDRSRSMCAFGGYLANISPSHYRELFESQLPSHLQGSEFLDLYGPHLDSVTSIDPGVNYALREPTSHPIHENFRVNSFRALLAAADALGDAATAAMVGGEDEARHRLGSSGHESRLASSSGSAAADSAAAAAAGCGGAAAAAGVNGARSSLEDALGLQRLALHNAAPAAGKQQQQGLAPSSDGISSSSSSSSTQQQQQQQVQLVPVDEQPPAALLGPLETLGELMFQSHASYSACGLGSDGTNRLVNIVREHMLDARKAGCAPALYGAKITGGGCGGTVCVLGLAGSAGQAAVDVVVKQYQAETGYTPFVFAGSSVGAARFGHLRLIRRK
jgi:hypothetical protein